jgi:NADH-quinone oxidoreductase subunit N
MVPFPDLLPALPEIILALAGLGLLMAGVFMGEQSTRLICWLAVAAFVLAGLVVAFQGGGRDVTFGGAFVVDGFGRFMKLLVLLGAAIGVLMSYDYLEREKIARFEYPVLFIFATTGMMTMISANDLISLYLGLELQSLALYVVAAFQRDNLRSSEAGLKYFVLGALSSGMLLYGASLVYGFAGTTAFDSLATLFSTTTGSHLGVVAGLVFICAGLAFKVSAVPFHMWTPDVYEGAPTPVTAFFAVAPKIAAMALFVRVLVGPFYDLIAQWQQIIIAAAVLSMILGAFAAIVQTNIKRLMAYSSIGHVGFALIGLAAGTEQGITAVLVYLAIYLAMNVGAFAVIISMRVEGKAVETIQDLAGLSRTRPLMAGALLVAMFSMAGIPPLAGFFGKLYVFQAAIEAGFVTLAIIGVLASVVSAFYYLRIVKVMYFDEAGSTMDEPAAGPVTAVMVVSTAFTVLFWIFPAPIVNAAATAARTLFGA